MRDAARSGPGGESPPPPSPSPRGGGDATRRAVIAGAAASLCAGAALAADRLGEIEAKVGGRLGVAALDLANGARLAHRGGERFIMCSTFKAMAVAAALKRVDAGQDRLDRFIRYGEADLLSYAPVTRAHVQDGGMPLGGLLEAAVELSDNTAANLVLGAIGGPPGWTRFVRSIGDRVSELDRTEPTLNAAIPGNPSDTTTPWAMVGDLRQAVLGDALSPASRQRLQGWMVACKTGLTQLRAGLPAAWRVGDKTGNDGRTTTNDIAVVWTPTRPIVIACYLTDAGAVSTDARMAAIADVGRLVAATFRPNQARG